MVRQGVEEGTAEELGVEGGGVAKDAMADPERGGAPPQDRPEPEPEPSARPAESQDGLDEPPGSEAPDDSADDGPVAEVGSEDETVSGDGAGPEDADDEPEPAGPAREVTDQELEREVAALLLASPDPLSTPRLRKLLGVPKARVEAALGALSGRLEGAGLPWELRAIAGGWQLYTTPDMADTVAVLSKVKKEEKVSPAALETLAVVAYRQPVTKAEIEAIRGVQVGPVLRTLVDRGLVKIVGRAEVPGSPLLYGTTRRFLDAFGLLEIGELPRDAELIKD